MELFYWSNIWDSPQLTFPLPFASKKQPYEHTHMKVFSFWDFQDIIYYLNFILKVKKNNSDKENILK